MGEVNITINQEKSYSAVPLLCHSLELFTLSLHLGSYICVCVYNMGLSEVMGCV